MKPIFRTFLLLLLLPTLAWSANTAPDLVRFTVVAEDNGQPVPNALIRIGGREAVAAEDGKASFPGLGNGPKEYTVIAENFEDAKGTVVLKDGPRPPVEVKMKSSTFFTWNGVIRSARGNARVSGARIRLVPKKHTRWQTEVLVNADISGEFTIPRLTGDYTVQVRAPGFADLDFDLPSRDLARFKKILIQPTSREKTFTVHVKNCASGKPIANAQVSLFEAPELGEFGHTVTDQSGRAAIQLHLGQWTRNERGWNLPGIQSRRAIVRAVLNSDFGEVAVDLLRDEQATVCIAQSNNVEEQEPNNEIANAQTVGIFDLINFRINPADDIDTFRFTLPFAAYLEIRTQYIGMETTASLLGGDGKEIVHSNAYRDRENVMKVVLQPGTYYYSISEWGRNQASEQEGVITFSVQSLSDAYEPNDSQANAYALTLPATVRAKIGHNGDQDYYLFRLDYPGLVRVRIPARKLEMTTVLRDENGQEITHFNGYQNRELRGDISLEAGTYYLQVTEWGNNGWNLEPYQLWVDYFADDDNIPVHVDRSTGMAEAVIQHLGDRDSFIMSIPRPGHLRVRTYGQLERIITISTPEKEVEGKCYANRSSTSTADFNAPGPAEIKVREWGDNGWSSSPIMIETTFFPADLYDSTSRNESMETATPVSLGEEVHFSINPLADQDWFQLTLDHAGELRLFVKNRVELSVHLLDQQGRTIWDRNIYNHRSLDQRTSLLPGVYYLHLHEWGDNGRDIQEAFFRTEFIPADPAEDRGWDRDPVRRLALGVAQPLRGEIKNDIDRYEFRAAEKGEYLVAWQSLGSGRLIIDSGSGTPVKPWVYANRANSRLLALESGQRVRITYQADAPSMHPGYLVVLRKEETPAWATAMTKQEDPLLPTRITFACQAHGADAIRIFPLGNQNRASLSCQDGDTAHFSYPRQGVYQALVLGMKGGKTVSSLTVPVNALGQPVLQGLHVNLSEPLDQSVIEEELTLRASAVNYDGTGIAKVSFLVNGRNVGSAYQAPYGLQLDRKLLTGSTLRIQALAVDRNGRTARSQTATVKLSPFFNLFPRDNATVTSRVTRFTWSSRTRLQPQVDYRLEGENEWQSARGSCLNGHCTVDVPGLEWRKVYEFRARLGSETSPVRRFTRVKGLAFTAPAYSANIRRDYAQTAVVTVQNNGDEPIEARLKCAKPNSRLLVSLVGDGSEDKPVTLKPNERRTFTLGLSAQDVLRESHAVNVFIESADGSRSDQAVINVVVDMPEIKMQWEKIGPTESGLGTRFRLINNGDPVTDLRVSASRGFTVSPEISHGFLKHGDQVEISVYPVLSDGFSGITGELSARAIATEVKTPIAATLPAGKKIFLASLVPGSSGEDPLAKLRAEIRAQAAAYLDPRSVDWKRPSQPVDTDLNGRPDQWTFPSPDETVLWTGHDTDGDGKVDFATADVGKDSIIDFAAYRTKNGWEPTNLVDAVLETKFSLPWSRKDYRPHTVHIVYNDTVIGTIKDRLPEGNFVFRIPQSAIRFDATGRPLPAELKVVTEHLPGGHYIVNNDYQLRTRMTGVTAYAVGATRQEAIESLSSYPGVAVTGPDYSVDTAKLKVSRTTGLKPGDTVRLATVIANFGASTSPTVDVALVRRSLSGGREREIARKTVSLPSITSVMPISFTWTATPGPAQLVIVADPDGTSGDRSRENNEAITVVEVAGQESDLPPFAPTLEEVTGPDAGTRRVFAISTGGIPLAAASLTIDDQPAVDLRAKGKKELRVPLWLEPGEHRLLFSLTDGDGQKKELTTTVTIKAKTPKLIITEPKTTTVNQAKIIIRTKTDAKIAMAAVRISGHPWKRMKMARGETKAELYLPQGTHTIEVMVVGKNGARTLKTLTLNNTHQLTPEEREALEKERRQALSAAADKKADLAQRLYNKLRFDGRIPTKEGVVDAFKAPNQVMAPPPQPKRRRRGGKKGGQNQGATGAGSPAAAPGTAPQARQQQKQENNETNQGQAPAASEPQFAVQPVVKVPPPKPRPEPEPGKQPGAAPAWPTASPSPATGSTVMVTKKKHDWYCTNRPKIKNRFTLPDWLRRKKLPKPGTKEYERLLKKYLSELRKRGYDTRALERFQRALIRRISQLEQPGQLPGFFESIGFADPKPTDPKELARWRAKMKAAAEAWWLRLLASGDPRLIRDGLRARAHALGQYDQAMAEYAGAVVDTVQANQEFAENVIESFPVAGEVLDVYAVYYGKTALSGREVTALERTLRLLGVAGPSALKAYYAAKPGLKRSLKKIAQSLGEVGQAGRRRLAALLGTSEEVVERAMRSSSQLVEESAEKTIKKLDDKIDDSLRGFRASKEGQQASKIIKKDLKQAKNKLNKLEKLNPGSKKFKKQVLQIQKDKTAQALINETTSPATREAYNKVMRNIYNKADDATSGTIKRLAKMSDEELVKEAGRLGIPAHEARQFKKQMENLAKKHGVSVDDLHIRGTDFSGNALDKVGRDRDVTFKIFVESVDKDGNKVLKELADVHHDVTRSVYEQNFWKHALERPLPMKNGKVDMDRISAYAAEMDQAVTSKTHAEAYAIGKSTFCDFIEGKGALTHSEAVADTVTYKGRHWFERAAKATDPAQAAKDTAEGMRQITKQWRRLIEPRLNKYYGKTAAKTAVPAKLKKAIDIFQDVEDGAMNVFEAEAALKAIGMSKEKTLNQLNTYIVQLEKTAGRTHRVVGARHLSDAIEQIKAPKGSRQWLDDVYDKITTAFKKGDISQEEFMKQRAVVSRSVTPKTFKNKKALEEWIDQAVEKHYISPAEAKAMRKHWPHK